MKLITIYFLCLFCSLSIAEDFKVPALIYPLEGIRWDGFVSLCDDLFRALPENTRLLTFHMYETDKTFVATAWHAATEGTNRMYHVFENEQNRWVLTGSGRPSPWINTEGMPQNDVNAIIKLATPELNADAPIVAFRWDFRAKAVFLLTGGFGDGLAGRGDGYIFEFIEGKWVLTKKSNWIS